VRIHLSADRSEGVLEGSTRAQTGSCLRSLSRACVTASHPDLRIYSVPMSPVLHQATLPGTELLVLTSASLDPVNLILTDEGLSVVRRRTGQFFLVIEGLGRARAARRVEGGRRSRLGPCCLLT
jgi:hypothetical protein